MRDRDKLETLLIHRFPGATAEQVAAAANAIMALSDEWRAADQACLRSRPPAAAAAAAGPDRSNRRREGLDPQPDA